MPNSITKDYLELKFSPSARDLFVQRIRSYISIFILGVLTISGCSFFDLPEEPGVLLFQDDFSSPNSGWDRYHGESYISDYDNGAYRIAVFQKNVEAWALPGLDLSDVIIEVTATSVNDPEDNVFGVLCRYQDPENFYFFLISSDGFSGIGVSHQGKRELLTGESMLPSDVILKGIASNLIQVQCIRDKLSISVNGTTINEVVSNKLKSGDVGLIAGTYEYASTEILFDNFTVRNP